MKLQDQMKTLITALQWYAREENYDCDSYDNENVPGARVLHPPCSRCGGDCKDYFEPDRGQRARVALAEAAGIRKCAHGRVPFHCEWCKEDERSKASLVSILR